MTLVMLAAHAMSARRSVGLGTLETSAALQTSWCQRVVLPQAFIVPVPRVMLRLLMSPSITPPVWTMKAAQTFAPSREAPQ